MLIKVVHKTVYTYDAPVSQALQQVRLRPTDGPLQTVKDWDLEVEGGSAEASYRDHHGNLVSLICADEGVTSLTITARGEVDTHDKAGVLGKVYGRAPLWYFLQSTQMTDAGPLIHEIADEVRGQGTDLEVLHRLSAAILERVPYALNETHVETKAEEAVSQKSGVCQDHANIFTSAARLLGFPARYVSGYLFMDDRVDQEASHAWAEVHIVGLGWVGFDISNQISPDERYIRLAVGRDARDAAPISGLRMGEGDETLIVSLQVQQ
ncbi:transglutaminase family protein [Gymnodinialimonas ceratoperidinii]|uniref:Transglutaminase family protein n=1 Tax=Gymnodinialimonas ceratoperidinii TaxID=2856823 RepID=A0A8F6TY72_9RHOB|nr:transglutaminase family protein [Gymnodinialimonas ceratoperidinii]QXT40633.1 transglutaminase family protein [Gymnodinialimonas ceratoperidinii]